MKCQYCDSVIDPVPGNGISPNCGSALKTEPPKPPFPMVKARGGTIEFNAQDIRLHIRQPKKLPTDVTIPYTEIYDVSYVPAHGWFNGFLCVREKKRQHIPLPREFGEQRLGDTFIYFDKWDNDDFLQAYIYLKQCIRAGEIRK